jgi:glycolate oxidase FAD binding subunit
MTWLECGNPLSRIDVVLSLERMRRIAQFSPPDLTVTVEAGLGLDEFTTVAVRERQWLPFDPPGSASASLGAIVACNSSGALRLGFGTPRDYVIGLKLAHADGTESKSGGQVVKNVAGYDMNKLYVGSYGTLAIITELTFKLRPLAECAATMMIKSKSRRTLLDLAAKVLASELQPSSVVLVKGLVVNLGSGLPDEALLIRFINSKPAVNDQVDWVTRTLDDTCMGTVLTCDEADTVWAAVAQLDERGVGLKLSVPLAAVAIELEKALLSQLDCVATADLGVGIIRMALNADAEYAVDLINRLRASAAAANGSLVIEHGSAEVRRRSDAWGNIGSSAGLMRAIKSRFDPQGLLNPGKFVAGI